jgi:leader peptidase (prepilin peptidase)/N-methyltransferase
MPTALAAPLAAVFGAVFGSFFNVVAYRLPRGESLSRPGSHCPKCETPIRLRGRCRACGERISSRYPIVEALTALLAVAVILARHATVDRALGLVLVAVLVTVSLIDLDTRRIPNKITGPAAVGAILLCLVLKPSVLPAHLLCGALGAGFLLIFALAYPRGLGMGDVKLAGVLGLYLGSSVVVALFGGILTGALVGLGVMTRVGVARGRKTAIPFGPFLAIGGVIAILAGPQILHWYVHHFVH